MSKESTSNGKTTKQNGSDVRKRWVPNSEELPEDWDPDLPYGGKVYLARKKKPDSIYVTIAEGAVICFVIFFTYYAYFYFENLHFHVTHAYAKMGFPHAQHQIGQRYLHGVGVDQHGDTAMQWFHKASEQGHPHASYNLAVGHMKGYKTELKAGDTHRLIAHAASKGVKEAHNVLNDVCTQGGCP